MATITEMVTAVVVQSSAAAFSHFGVMLEPTQAERAPPPVERVIARTPAKPAKAVDCPLEQKAPPLKV
jgi:hypothetical protein